MYEQPSNQPLGVLIQARQPIARAGLRGLVAESGAAQVSGQATTPSEAAALAQDLAPDVVLAAWEAGETEDLAELSETLASTRVPLLLVGDEPASGELAGLLRAGVRGFLLSTTSPSDLGLALRAATAGLVVLDQELGRAVYAVTPLTSLSSEEPLTEREREVLQLLALGLANKTIASRLRISEHTAKFHVASIMSKLHAASRTEAVTRAARQGLLAL